MTDRLAIVLILLGILSGEDQVRGQHAVAFVYHRFAEDRYPSTSVSLEQFDSHLQYLAREDYSVLPLEEIVARLREGGELPDRSVALTVDDGYRSVYQHAYPRLKRRGWPFTVFVSTDAIDARLSDFMSWEQMREMGAHGASFANHSATHAVLHRRGRSTDGPTWRKLVRNDIEKAERRLREELGKAPPLFAYPYGEYDKELAELVKELGFTAFGQQSGAMGAMSDTRALPRFPVAGAYTRLESFKVKAASLPLPVVDLRPWDPVTLERRPRIEVRLGQSEARTDKLACFVGGQGKIPVQWLEPGRRFAVAAREELPRGRNRYNCTAPNRDGSRYFWFSQQWVVQ